MLGQAGNAGFVGIGPQTNAHDPFSITVPLWDDWFDTGS
jgi:hypothetical protein